MTPGLRTQVTVSVYGFRGQVRPGARAPVDRRSDIPQARQRMSGPFRPPVCVRSSSYLCTVPAGQPLPCLAPASHWTKCHRTRCLGTRPTKLRRIEAPLRDRASRSRRGFPGPKRHRSGSGRHSSASAARWVSASGPSRGVAVALARTDWGHVAELSTSQAVQHGVHTEEHVDRVGVQVAVIASPGLARPFSPTLGRTKGPQPADMWWAGPSSSAGAGASSQERRACAARTRATARVTTSNCPARCTAPRVPSAPRR